MRLQPHIALPLLLFAFAFALPVSEAGCNTATHGGKRACFSWTHAEGACPAQADAIDFFSTTACTPRIESVDSDGTFQGDRCCYDVTAPELTNDECASGSPAAVSAVAVAVGAGGASMGVGGAGSACQTCKAFATAAFQGMPLTGSCLDSDGLVNALFDCLCTGPCQSACGAMSCLPMPTPSSGCFDCATDSAIGCGAQFNACMDDI